MSRPSSGGTVRVERRRLDQILVDRGLAASRSQARALVMAREVLVAGQRATAAAARIPLDAEIGVRRPPRYVSRGGDKLAHALDRTGIVVRGARCLDAGASTGGFTDCLLQHGAAHVTAIDVGYGELSSRLRSDPRVEVRERTNVRHLDPLDPPVDVATADLSFISLALVLPAIARCVRPGGDLLTLVKPQFEAGRAQVRRGGVVHDAAVHASVVAKVALAALDLGLRVRGVIRSPLLGPAGNREFFLWLRRPLA